MSNKVYKKYDKTLLIKRIRFAGLGIFGIGILLLGYFTLPLLSWKIYFEPVFAANTLEAPVPKRTVLNASAIQSLIATAVNSQTTDYANAANWFPTYVQTVQAEEKPVVTTYNLSIPKIKLTYANVSTVSTDLSKHLVHYNGTAIPPERGNAIIFGHSTLPQLFNSKDYMTIFARAHLLKVGDEIIATVNAKEYKYTIESITITIPEDTTIFAQNYDNSYLTLVTCTPPGTTWKRLIIKSKLTSG